LAYDDMYEALIATHQGLTTEQSHALNARLVLLLANHIGELDVLREAFRLARRSVAPEMAAGASNEASAPIAPPAPSHAHT
jgi:hypothetical protein